MDKSRLTVAFLNFGHALDHLAMLIYATAVLAMTAEFGIGFQELLPLSLGGFLTFGAGALPAGWAGDRWGRRNMMVVFFLGIGAALVLAGLVTNRWQISGALTLIGVFASIYHPVGIAMLVKDQARIGRALGWNGVWGNLGVAGAAFVAGWLADHASWRAAFIVPGLVAVVAGIAFAILIPATPAPPKSGSAGEMRQRPDAAARRVFAILTVATLCSGVIFAATTNAMPKIFDERIAAMTHSTSGIGTLVSLVYAIAAMAQLLVGQLIDRRSLRGVFLTLAILQVPLLLLAGVFTDWAMLIIATATMFVIFGIIPINDAMVARFARDEWRSRVYAVRYVASFGASLPAIWLVAYFPPEASGFIPLFAVLAVIALGTLAAALRFPSDKQVMAAAAVPAE